MTTRDSLYFSSQPEPVQFLGHKPAPVRPRLFDYLRENAGKPVALADAVRHLYGSSPPAQAAQSVRSMVSRLNRELSGLGGRVTLRRSVLTYEPGPGGDPVFKGRIIHRGGGSQQK